MSTEHRVAAHLGVVAADYDRTIRTFIPHYEVMLATVASWLEGHVPPGGLVVDLGSGTGGLAAAILERLPEVRVELVDVDPSMLEVAAARCSPYEGRFTLRHGRFSDALPRCHAVVASFALHHVRTPAEKRDLYRAIRQALEPAGLVVVADALVYPEGPERVRMFGEVAAHMATHGISATEAQAHFAQWAEEDVFVPLPDELALIADAGFPRPEVFWRDGLDAVYGAFNTDGPTHP
jgi:SAM-dependent methyltransferase